MGSFVQEALRANPRIIMEGRGGLLVENSAGICEFSENGITLRTAEGALLITGTELTILRAEQDCVTVCGNIKSVAFI